MRHYETLFIITPDITEEESAEVVEKYTSLVADQGGIMAKVDNWGRRRLAYEVKKFNKGYFVLFDYGAEPALVLELERNFKIDEQVIRFLTVKQGDAFDPESIKAEPQEPVEEEASGEAEAQPEAEASEEAEAQPEAEGEPSEPDETPQENEDQPAEAPEAKE